MRAYTEATRTSMWASQVELQIASDILEISLMYTASKLSIQLGRGIPSYAIKKFGNHYILARVHKRKRVQSSMTSVYRGGMMSWTWETSESAEHETGTVEHEVPQAVSTNYMHDPYTTVKISEKIKTDVRRITFTSTSMTIADLKARLSSMLKLPVSSMVILDDEDENEMPDWTSLPSSVILTVLGNEAKLKLDVHIPMRDAQFSLEVSLNIDRTELENKLAAILRVPPQDMRILNARGFEWRACINPEDHVLHVHIVERAGMRRTASPTVPYGDMSTQPPQQRDTESEESQEARQQRVRDQIEGAHDGRRDTPSSDSRMPSPRASRSRSRSRTRSMSPVTSLRRGSASPTRHGHWATSYPTHIHPAQAEPVSKPVLQTNMRPVGYIWAGGRMARGRESHRPVKAKNPSRQLQGHAH